MALRASRWIQRQYDEQTGGYRLSPVSPPCLIGSACAVLASETLGCADELPDKSRLAAHILSYQEPDGWFVDPLLRPPQGEQHSEAYMWGHGTFHALMALDALGAKPDHPLEFLDRWRGDGEVYDWIEQLDWSNPWRESNWVEWIGFFLLADAGLSVDDVPIQGSCFPPGFGGLLQWLEDHQDPETGFWGEPPYEDDLRTLHLMAAAYHHYVFFYATDHPIRGLDRIVDQTLALQQVDGLFFPGCPGSNPCVDLDAIDILANMHRLTDYRREDIETSMQRSLLVLLRNQRRDGAFSHCVPPDQSSASRFRLALFSSERSGLGRIAHLFFRRAEEPNTCYAGCSALPFNTRSGDMFAQWFRPLAITIAATVLGPERAPVWWHFGFRKQITQGWWPGEKKH